MERTKQQREVAERLRKFGSQARPDATSEIRRLPGKAVKEVFEITVDRIRVDEQQVRKEGKSKDAPEIKELAASIAEHGLLQYPEVRYIEADDIYQLISGEGRYTACVHILEWEALPCKLVDVSEEEAEERQWHENLHRRALSAFDMASGVERFRKRGLTIDQIAAKLKKSKSLVQQAITISERLTPEAGEALRGTEQGASLGIVYQAATVDADEQVEFAEQIVGERLTKQQVVDRATERKSQSKSTEDRRRRGGKRAKTKPREDVFRVNGATVHIKFRKKNVSDGEVAEALRAAIDELTGDVRKAA